MISTRPLIELCPVVPAAMEGRQIVQWDKDSCADAGFLKIDLLGLGMLSAVERCVEEIARARGERLDLSRIPLDDERDLRVDPRGRDDRRLPDREPGADADAAAHAAARTSTTSPCRWRWCGPGRSRAAPSTPTSSGKKLLREDPAYEVPYEHPSLEPVLERHARGDRLPGAGDRGGDGARRLHRRRGGGAAAGDEPQALGGGAATRYRERFVDGAVAAAGSTRRWPSGSSSRSWASPASASPRRTRPPSACSPTSRPGCGSTTGRSSSARC